MNSKRSLDPQPGLESRKPLVTCSDVVWGPLAVGSLLLAVGLIGLAAGQPWLFPSLGPSAFLAAEDPNQPSSRFFNTVVGHLVGLAAGMAAVFLLGADSAPAVQATGHLVALRVWAAVLATIGMMIGLAILRASHPPAAATVLLIALGGFRPTWASAQSIIAGVLILAVLGEGVRYLRREVILAPEQRS